MSGAPKRILVIDDSELILEATRLALAEAGFDVCVTTEPAAPEGFSPDLILLDVHMPQLFGDDVARFFREERGMTAQIFLYSTYPEPELAERARDAGATGYISKGWGLEKMVERVRAALG